MLRTLERVKAIAEGYSRGRRSFVAFPTSTSALGTASRMAHDLRHAFQTPSIASVPAAWLSFDGRWSTSGRRPPLAGGGGRRRPGVSSGRLTDRAH